MQKDSSSKSGAGKRPLSPKMVFRGKINEKPKHFEVTSTKRVRNSTRRGASS